MTEALRTLAAELYRAPPPGHLLARQIEAGTLTLTDQQARSLVTVLRHQDEAITRAKRDAYLPTRSYLK